MIKYFGRSDEMKTTLQKSNFRESLFGCHRKKMIRTGWGKLFVLALWVLIFPASAGAQGWWWGSPVTPGYDLTSVIEISGTVMEVDRSQRVGSTLRIESSGETFTVTLGPSWYLRQQRADFQTGDKLMVRGSKMKTREGKTYLVASRIKNMRTGHDLELRDEKGRPLWSSKRRLEKEGGREVKQ